jgi:hypothetical protein
MELVEVISRYAQALGALDSVANTDRANQRTGEFYKPGIKGMTEPQVVKAVDQWWGETYPQDFLDPYTKRVGVKYLEMQTPTKCDHVFTTEGNGAEPEWAIEWKNVVLVGDNGKRNDFTTGKILSPYLKDRSLLHDVLRLRQNKLARRHAVVGYGFNYDMNTCEEAKHRFPEFAETVLNMQEVCRGNGGELSIHPLLDFAEPILQLRGLVSGPRAQSDFTAWAHPAGGNGIVFGWEVRRPELESNFDPRHPW